MPAVEKQYYRLREVCAITQLPASTLRYWEQQFIELSPRKDGHGNRYYTKEDIALIKRIKYIRDELKITRIEAIQRELHTDSKQSSRKQTTVDILRHIRTELAEVRRMLYIDNPDD